MKKGYESNNKLSTNCNSFVIKKQRGLLGKSDAGDEKTEGGGRWQKWRVYGWRFGWRGVKELEKQGEDGGRNRRNIEWWAGWCKQKKGLETSVHFNSYTKHQTQYQGRGGTKERGRRSRQSKDGWTENKWCCVIWCLSVEPIMQTEDVVRTDDVQYVDGSGWFWFVSDTYSVLVWRQLRFWSAKRAQILQKFLITRTTM